MTPIPKPGFCPDCRSLLAGAWPCCPECGHSLASPAPPPRRFAWGSAFKRLAAIQPTLRLVGVMALGTLGMVLTMAYFRNIVAGSANIVGVTVCEFFRLLPVLCLLEVRPAALRSHAMAAALVIGPSLLLLPLECSECFPSLRSSVFLLETGSDELIAIASVTLVHAIPVLVGLLGALAIRRARLNDVNLRRPIILTLVTLLGMALAHGLTFYWTTPNRFFEVFWR